jgi:YD repeat-containing protein
MSQGFGAGWSLPSAEIVNGNAASWYDVANDGSGVCDSFDPTAYTLYLNGASYPLEYIDTTPNMSRHGEYTAVGDPSLRIRQEVHNSEIDPNNNHNVTGEYWEVATGDGTVYLFGFNEHAEQVIGPLKGLDCEANAAQPRNHQEFAATSWKLEQVTNVYGETIYYEYGTKCGIYDGCRRYNLNSNTIPESNIGNNGIYIFPDSGAQPAGKFRTEVDVALSTIRYNDAQNTEILFSYEEQNSSLIHAVGNAVGDTIFFMKVGFFRPDHLVVQHEGNVVSAYHFDYDSEKHVRHDNDNNSTDFWWLTGITAYGADYDIVTQTGTSLPPPEFFYDKDNKNGCGLNDIDEKEQEWVCVPFLTRVESGYGAVSKLKYTDIINEQETDWYIVTQVETWDGIEYIYSGEGIGNKAQSRIVYDRTGFVRCHDREGHGCDNPSDEESDALVGFSGVAIEVQKYESSISGWVTLSKQMKTFDVGEVEVYWLNGKTLTSSTYDSNDLKLTEQTFNWDWIEEPDVNENVTIYFARLNWRSNINYDPNGGNQKIGTCETYTYDKNSQGGKQWGRRTNTTYYHSQNITSSCGDTGWQEHHSMATYYATSHPNPHLILPWAIGLVGSQNEPLQLTLNYYDGATYPDAQTLTHGELTLSRSVLLNESEPNGNGLKFPTVDTTFAYDGYGNVISTTTYSDYGMVGYANANGTNWNYVVSPTGPRTTEMAYSSDGLTVTWVEDALDHRTNFTYEDLDIPWLMTKITDPNLLDTHFEYDPFGRLFAVYDDDDDRGEEWGVKGDGDPLKLYHYEDTGWSGDPFEPALNWTPNNPNGLLIVEETRPFHYPDDGSGPYSLAQYTYYDGLGRPVHTRNREAEVNGAIVRQDLVTFTTYNAQGLVDCASMSFGLIEGLSGWSDYYDCHAISEGIKTGYDALGRTKVVTAPDGSETQYFYGVSDDFTPGIVHNRMSVVDANGYAISQGLNAWGQLVYAQEFTGTSYPYTLYAQTDYEYDLMGHLIKVTDDAGNETEMTYDALGRKLTMDDPDMGLWGYDYNPAGNLIEQTDAKASTICFLYDDLERLTTKVDVTTAGVCPTTIPSWPSSDVLSRYYYDGTNAIGNLSAVTAADFDAQWDAFDYGSDGLLMGQRRVVNGRKYTLDYLEYDSLDRPTRIQYPNDEIVDVTYDHEGENSLGIEGGSLIGTDVRYNARSQMTYLGRGNSVATTYSYFGVNPDPGANPGDSNYRLKTIQHGSTFDSLPDFTYSYDIVGNILSRSYLSYQEGFGYDHLNRLMDVIAINDIMIDYEHVYTYDELGNIVERDTTKYEQLAAGPHAVTHVDNEQVFGYDANGNMITRTLGIDNYTQVFDIQNRLIEVVDNNTGDSTRFAYDASGQRVMTTRPDGSILYTPFPQFEEEVRPDYEGTGTDELIIGETGQVLVTNSWQTLTFNHNYRHPVVIAQASSKCISAPTLFGVMPSANNPPVFFKGHWY